MTFSQRVDVSSRTSLAVCGCGWRQLVTGRDQGWARLLEHARSQADHNSDAAALAVRRYS